MSDLITEKVDILTDDIKKIKNDLNIVKANTQVSANLLSLLHGDNILEMVFATAKSEKLCNIIRINVFKYTAKGGNIIAKSTNMNMYLPYLCVMLEIPMAFHVLRCPTMKI